MLARLIPVNVNYRYTGNELAHLFTRGNLSGLVVDAEYAPLAASVAQGSQDLRHVLVTGDSGTCRARRTGSGTSRVAVGGASSGIAPRLLIHTRSQMAKTRDHPGGVRAAGEARPVTNIS
jgi:acyl-CoA synthetase (AMP-forming)/AMP-acid ligase II